MSHDDQTRIAALRLALAVTSDSLDAYRVTVDEISERRDCWACIARELLCLVADLVDDTGIRYIEGMLAEALDGQAAP